MKIALVTEYYYPYMGGISEHVHNLYLQLRLHGHEVKIVTPAMRFLGHFRRLIDRMAPDEDVIRICNSYPFYNNGGFVYMSSPFGLARELKRLFDRERFDVVHVHSPLIPILPILAVRDAPCPVAGTFHTVFRHALGYRVFRRQIEEQLLPKLGAKLAVAPECAEIMARYFQLNCKVVPNGVDTEMFQPGVPPVDAFRKGGKTKYLLFLGRFDPHNGLDILLRAFVRVRARCKACELIVVGGGALASKYQRMARGLVGDAVHFVGPQHRLRPNFYQVADIFCHPATLHATSLVNLEAMASGLPIVASDLPSFRWALRDGAVFFPKGDDKALAEGILGLLDDSALRQELGCRARRVALEYSWDKVGPRVIQEYHRLMGGAAVSVSDDPAMVEMRRGAVEQKMPMEWDGEEG